MKKYFLRALILIMLFSAFSENVSAQNQKRINPTQKGLKVQLYYRNMEYTDEETGEHNKSKIVEDNEFQSKRESMLCYDSGSFEKLVVSFSGSNLSIIVFETKSTEQGILERKVIFKKMGFNAATPVTFNKNQIKLSDINSRLLIRIIKNEEIIFEGTIYQEGCM